MSSVFKLLKTPMLLWSFILFVSALLINPAAGEQPDFAVDLNVTDFGAVLNDTAATYAIVEFFAHWSPACRNYKPQYEKVASLFNGVDAVHPGIILMTRVDCAISVNTNLCHKFSVDRYPMLFWGLASKFVASGWDVKDEKGEISPIKDRRTADRLLKWINTRLGSLYSFEDEKDGNAELLQSNVSDPITASKTINTKTMSFFNQTSQSLISLKDEKHETVELLQSNE